MWRGIPQLLTVAAVVAWAALWWLAEQDRSAVSRRSLVAAKPAIEKHFVTPDQLVECGALAERRIEPFAARAHDGSRFAWPQAGGARPLVVVFIKRGCPCSVEFEPFFHRLELEYREHADFLGVIDAEADVALAYATSHKVPYRVLADPDGEIVKRFDAKHGGYVALVRASNHLDTLWPGCSTEMMRALGRRIAALCAVAERPLDVSGMPKVLTTGCPFAS